MSQSYGILQMLGPHFIDLLTVASTAPKATGATGEPYLFFV
jgi:hypothetical protein